MPLETALANTLGADYTIENELGGGGMSRVFVARDRALNRRVVIKVLPPDLAAVVSTERFEREVLIAAGLQHPNIVPILTAGTADKMPFLVMPFVEGESLRNRLTLTSKVSVKEAIGILRDIARALAFAHDRGIIHRDIKPDNILLSAGVAMLGDFGVAKAVSSASHLTPSDGDPGLTRVGTSLGTPTYMAPEQAAADDATDHRADIYALGITAYEMLSGKPPFTAASPAALIAAHLTQPAPRLRSTQPEIPEWLDELVARCLSKDPAERPETADDVLEQLEDERHSVTGTPTIARTKKTLALFASAVIALSIATIFFVLRMGGTGGEVNVDLARVAVLPFVNVSGNPDDEYFTDGLTDELIGALGRIRDIRVASRTGSYAFKGSDASVGEIGSALNVGVLLEGTVRRGGNRLRLTAQLVGVEDGLTLWSETYEREMTDVFTVQDELTASIVGALQEHIGVRQQAVVPSRATTNVEAYDLYLRGRYFFGRRGEQSIREALDYFQQAVSLDETFAEAHAGIADVYSLLPLYTSTPGDSVIPLAIAAVNRAIQLDSTLASAYASRASLYTSAWRWDDASRDFERALALDDRYGTAHQWFGEHLLVRGEVEESVVQLARAVQLDPLSPIVNASYASALAVAGRDSAAIAYGTGAVDLDTASAAPRFLVGAAYLYIDQPRAALLHLRRAAMLAPNVASVHGLLGYAYAATGDTLEARRILDSIDRDDLRSGNGVAIARVFIGLGQLDSAIVFLSQAVDAHDPFFASESLASSIFDPIRGRPEFVDILTRVGLDPRLLAAQ